MKTLTKIVIGVVVAAVVLGGAAFAGWWFFIRSEAESPAAIEQARCTKGGPLDGTYRLEPGNPDSFVGYRVREVLAAVGVESTASGRTGDVEGSFTITGTTVEGVSVTANLLTLKSDREMRDNRIRTLGLESEQFPEATFELTEPIEFAVPERRRETVKATAVGDFTLHGVTRPVEIPIEGCRDGDGVQVVGRLPVEFGDYDIEAPTIANFVSVEDQGEMEFQLFFRRA